MMTTSGYSSTNVYCTMCFQHWSRALAALKLKIIARFKQGDTIVDVTRHELLTIRKRKTHHTLRFLSYGEGYITVSGIAV